MTTKTLLTTEIELIINQMIELINRDTYFDLMDSAFIEDNKYLCYFINKFMLICNDDTYDEFDTWEEKNRWLKNDKGDDIIRNEKCFTYYFKIIDALRSSCNTLDKTPTNIIMNKKILDLIDSLETIAKDEKYINTYISLLDNKYKYMNILPINKDIKYELYLKINNIYQLENYINKIIECDNIINYTHSIIKNLDKSYNNTLFNTEKTFKALYPNYDLILYMNKQENKQAQNL